MNSKEWGEYRDTAVFMHAVDTIGATMFSRVVVLMLLSGIPVTRESFDKEIHIYLDIARKENKLDDYFRCMLAHAYFDRNVTHGTDNL
jgi:hypothetical protein